MTDQNYMLQAIQLAKQGEGWTNPNPMVGAVIVKKRIRRIPRVTTKNFPLHYLYCKKDSGQTKRTYFRTDCCFLLRSRFFPVIMNWISVTLVLCRPERSVECAVILRRICQFSLTRITHQVSHAFDLKQSKTIYRK